MRTGDAGRKLDDGFENIKKSMDDVVGGIPPISETIKDANDELARKLITAINENSRVTTIQNWLMIALTVVITILTAVMAWFTYIIVTEEYSL